MKMLKDEQIFDILDGTAGEDILQQHAYLMAHSESYQNYFTELEALHLHLSGMPLEKPSAGFIENVMSAAPALQSAPVVLRTKSWAARLPHLVLGALVLVLLATITLVVLYPVGSGESNTLLVPRFMEIRDFLTGDFVKIVALMNLIALLVIFDRKVLRPYFSHRKITLG